MKTTKTIFIIVASVILIGCGGGGGGGGSSDDNSSIPSFDGVYEGPRNRVINSCNFSFDWQDVFSVEHNEGESTVTLQVGENIPRDTQGR